MSSSPGSHYYAIQANWLCPGKRIPFALYARDFSGEMVRLLPPHRVYAPGEDGHDRETEPSRVFIRKESASDLLHYLDSNLDEVIDHPRMDAAGKAEVFYYLAYRRLEAVYRSPGRLVLTDVKQIIALMIEQIITRPETLQQVYELVQKNAGRISEHPRSTILHSLNVGILSTFFVTTVLGHLPREIAEEIALAYFFHNIGMMLLPRDVVNQRGDLSDRAWALIRQHPRWGVEIMGRRYPLTPEMGGVIGGHHERLDGKGYPGVLKSSDLHFFVKTCAVMDTLHALISRRAYREPLPLAEALREVRHRIPQGYDPRTFSQVIRVFREYGLF
jgi:HD-GYP domain-containing protein (c-di-GMP phosphodiesterase class II)